MSQSAVYFIPATNKPRASLEAMEIVLTFKAFKLLEPFKKKDLIGLKLHLNETGSKNHIPPANVTKLVNILRQKQVTPFICDTTSSFRDRAYNAVHHLNQIRQHGFGDDAMQIPVIMLDGVDGRHETNVYSENKHSPKIPLAGELLHFKGIIILSACELNSKCGMEGAIHNLGYGLSSKRGKIRLFSISKPQVNTDRCYYCQRCIHACPTQAIHATQRQVTIDESLCINCGKCVDIAKYGGITYQWDADDKNYRMTLIQHARGALKLLKHNALFINFLPKNHGMLISKDPVAIDQASADILKNSMRHLPENPIHKFYQTTSEGAKTALGNSVYVLKNAAY